LFLSNKSFNFALVLCISYFNSFTSITICSLIFSTFCLINSYVATMLLNWKICTVILSIVCFLVSYSYSYSCFFLSKLSTLCLYFIIVFLYEWFVLVHVSSFCLNSMHSFFNSRNSSNFYFISLFSVASSSIFTLSFFSISFFFLFQICICCLYSSYP
jgi:hypothetical protein